jgi:hypothetical protein
MTNTSLASHPLIAFSGVIAAAVMPAEAAKRQPAPQPVVERSASGTIIQPTTTIVPDGTGHARVVVIPRRRSYLDTGTEVSVGDRKFNDYASWPGGDPGRPKLVLRLGLSRARPLSAALG